MSREQTEIEVLRKLRDAKDLKIIALEQELEQVRAAGIMAWECGYELGRKQEQHFQAAMEKIRTITRA